jgi:hypothetical protein
MRAAALVPVRRLALYGGIPDATSSRNTRLRSGSTLRGINTIP